MIAWLRLWLPRLANSYLVQMGLGFVIIMGTVVGVQVYGASVEAKTYNRFTGGDATTWEALWTNFRVDCD